jgi:hypothetical protein
VKILLAAALVASPALAQDKLRDLCSDRPGLNTPACTVDPGHLQVEAGLANWTLDKQSDTRTDTVLAGEVLARYGVGKQTEVRLGWTAFGHVRTRDRATGSIDRTSGVGDITIGVKQNFAGPDGDGFSVALLPYATLPTGKSEIGEGDWGAGLLIPLSYDLSEHVKLEMTPEADAAVDEDGHGRHFAYGSAAGIGLKLGEKMTLSGEAQLIRHRDPVKSSTQALAALSMTYQPKPRLQFDIGAQAGLNHATPDLALYAGVSEKF